MQILILRTSADTTMQKLLKELDNDTNKKIDCLIQSSQIERYQEEYPYINFIDIYRDRFESLPTGIIDIVSKKRYDQLYITLTGVSGYNFWNVMELVSKIHFKKAFFYNCNGEKLRILGKNIIRDTLCRWYIRLIGFIYG